METFKTATAVLFLFTSPAFADEAETKDAKPRRVTPLERNLVVPDIIGLQIGSTAATLSGLTSLSGIVSYSYSDMTTSGSHATFESFGINPSFDARVGRFTVGGTVRLVHASAHYDSPFVDARRSTTLSLQVVPRVGMLFPIVPHVTFWPRVGVGLTAASSQLIALSSSDHSTSAGVLATADALVVVDLGSRFFVSAGPSVHFLHTSGREQPFGTEQRSTSFHAGATVAMGVAF